MNKELEALEEIRDFRYGKDKLLVCQTAMYDDIKQALQRLEAIDNANPSEALKWLEDKGEQWVERGLNPDIVQYKETQSYREIKQALLKAQEQEKELKAFEIIKKKKVNVIRLFTNGFDIDLYHSNLRDELKLTQEEFELLKEVLSDER